ALTRDEVILLCLAALWAGGFCLVRGRIGTGVLALAFCGLVGWSLAAPDTPFAWNYAAARKRAYEESLAESQRLRVLTPTASDPQRVFFFRNGESLTGPTWNPNIAMLAGFYDVFGYVNPSLKAPFQAFLWGRKQSRMLSLLDVRTIATDPSG